MNLVADLSIGSNSLRWWTRTQRIRTASMVPVEVSLLQTEERPLHQQIARKAAHLGDLALSLSAIARQLGVDDKTVAKAIRWIQLNEA